eukprot:886794-Amphidinium_carterae.1
MLVSQESGLATSRQAYPVTKCLPHKGTLADCGWPVPVDQHQPQPGLPGKWQELLPLCVLMLQDVFECIELVQLLQASHARLD